MKVNELACLIWESLQDKKEVTILEQTIKDIKGEKKILFVRVDGKKYPISKKMALSAINHGANIGTLPKEYRISSVRFTI